MTAAAVGALAGALWALDYGFVPWVAVAWIALHAVLGALIGTATRFPPRPRMRVPTRAVESLAVVGALALAPALLAQLARSSPISIRVQLALLGASWAASIVLARGAAWGGRLACAFWALCLGLGLVAARSPGNRILPMHPTLAQNAQPTKVQRLAVIGLDGADWRVIEPLIARGELPNLAALRARGSWAVLHSIEPTYSPVVWTSIFSGKRPEKHGITDWYTSQAGNRKAAVLWDIVGASGGESVVVNVPGSWPPRKVRGVLVAGFPLPSAVETPGMPLGQHVGMVLQGRIPPAGEHAAEMPGVPVLRLRLDRDGARVAAVPTSVANPRTTSGLSHVAVRYLGEGHHLAVRSQSVRVEVGPPASDGGAEQVKILGHAVDLRPGEWSSWLHTRLLGIPVQFRLRRLEGDSLFLTPFFEDPSRPYHRFVSDSASRKALVAENPYVVEGIGWMATVDPAMREPFAEEEQALTRSRVRAVRVLLRTVPDWRLLAVVYTITDRMSHAFWRFYDPASFPPIDPVELRANASRVEDAYREADRALGKTLEHVGPETTVVVLSDHGFTADPPNGSGTHRKEGIFVAAGPGIRPRKEPLDLTILDVTPTLLAALGLPVPEDMDGRARLDVLDGVPTPTRIASYELKRPTATAEQTPTRIDASTEEQLRSLGYIR